MTDTNKIAGIIEHHELEIFNLICQCSAAKDDAWKQALLPYLEAESKFLRELLKEFPQPGE